jgi:hypothetical protein
MDENDRYAGGIVGGEHPQASVVIFAEVPRQESTALESPRVRFGEAKG